MFFDSLSKMGVTPHDIYVNSYLSQAWASTNGRPVARGARFYPKVKKLGNSRMMTPVRRRIGATVRSLLSVDEALLSLISDQVHAFNPDVVVNMAMETIEPQQFRHLCPPKTLLVGWGTHSALEGDQSIYDLVVGALNVSCRRLSETTNTLFLPHCFPEHALTYVQPRAYASRAHSLSFVGSFHGIHEERAELLARIAETFPETRIWAPTARSIPSKSLRDHYAGPAWGREMYAVLADSRIVINHHGRVPEANNSRLYEVTGLGALLLTDNLPGLDALFSRDEVLTYGSATDAVEEISWALSHPREASAIAERGQDRTHTVHTCCHRMEAFMQRIRELL